MNQAEAVPRHVFRCESCGRWPFFKLFGKIPTDTVSAETEQIIWGLRV